jgi:hypothetical protein
LCDPFVTSGGAIEEMKKVVEEKITLFGSKGKA